MRRLVKLATAIAMTAMGATMTWAQSFTPPVIEIDGSLPIQYTNNAFRAPVGTVQDFFTSPFLKLSANGDLHPNLSYSIYGSGGIDKFFQHTDADDALATAGANLSAKAGSLTFGTIYEHNYAYDGIYRSLLFIADDVTGYVRYNIVAPFGLIAKPSLAASYRFADEPSAQRYLYTLKLDLSQKITDNLSLVSTPKIRFYSFTDGINNGRHDQLFSMSGGLRYAFSPEVSLTTSASYEHRNSNFRLKYY